MKPAPIDSVIERLGSQYRLAKVLGLRPSTVHHWVHGSRVIPPEKAIALEAATNGEIPRWMSRPDLWEAPAEAAQ